MYSWLYDIAERVTADTASSTQLCWGFFKVPLILDHHNHVLPTGMLGVVIQHIKGLGANKDLSLKQLTLKTVMLLRPSCSADLSKLNLQTRTFKSNGVVFHPIGQHTPVSSSKITRWLKSVMAEADIDISIFKAHSVRGASCSTAAGVGKGEMPFSEAPSRADTTSSRHTKPLYNPLDCTCFIPWKHTGQLLCFRSYLGRSWGSLLTIRSED